MSSSPPFNQAPLMLRDNQIGSGDIAYAKAMEESR